MAVEEGKKAPAFSLKDAAGKNHKLADYAGKDVIADHPAKVLAALQAED